MLVPQGAWTEPIKQNIHLKIWGICGSMKRFCEDEKFETKLWFLTKLGPLIPNTKVNSIGIRMEKVDYSVVGLQDRKIGSLNKRKRKTSFIKPLVNHFYDVNDQIRISSILYWPQRIWWWYCIYVVVFVELHFDLTIFLGMQVHRTWDWNAEIAQNSANVDSAWSETGNL
ncbi:MAG: hypothetical protein CM15mL4_3010 [uncultured marine virus]|nr:MAG: hypothetical protein CM15mL4_3010 [uncultured marine virus]